VVGKEGKRLELRLRPEDPFCKPACADRQESTSLLLRVRRRRRRKKKKTETIDGDDGETGEEAQGEDDYEYDTKIMGYCDATYSFSSKSHHRQ
jgi:general transcription factor 3C polypeptide 5 (transcription factor C subunit 1)